MIKTLINFSNEVNLITLSYVVKLGLTTQKTSVKVQKINSSLLETYDIALTDYLL